MDKLVTLLWVILLASVYKLPVEGMTYRSPAIVELSPDGTQLFVAEFSAHSIRQMNVSDGTVIRRLSLQDAPSGLCLSQDGLRLFVTAGVGEGRVLEYQTTTGKLLRQIEVGHSPMAPVLNQDGRMLYLCNRFSNEIAMVDLETSEVVKRVPVSREPVSACLTRDGRRLLVANHLPAGAADVDYVGAAISIVDAVKGQLLANLALPNGSMGLRDIVLSPDNQYAYVGHVLARYQVPATQLERGWINTNAISVIDVKKQGHFRTFLLDDLDLGAPNPWGIDISDDGSWLVVTHAGSHELSLIDRDALHESLNQFSAQQTLHQLNFVHPLRKRIKLPGLGPRGCSISGTKVYVAQYFSDDLAVVDLANPTSPQVATLSLGKTHDMDLTRRGEYLFNDGAYCFQQWQSCTSCHPSNRVDALNWDIMNDGIGNPKNTKSLLFSHQTPPTTVTGVRPNAETSVRAGIRFMGAVLPESDALALDAFLKSMKPVPSPYLEKGRLSVAARRGQTVFAKAKCNSCHSGPYFTDLKQYDVGLGEGLEFQTAFDVPTLREVWRTAPYLYDGRAQTIRELITKLNPEDKHGFTSQLSAAEVDDLVTYVLSL